MITERHMRTNQLITSLIALVSAVLCSYQSGYQYSNVLNGTIVRQAAGEGLLISFLLIAGATCGLLANIYRKKPFSFISFAFYFIGFLVSYLFGNNSFPGLFTWILISGLLAAETVFYFVGYFAVQKTK